MYGCSFDCNHPWYGEGGICLQDALGEDYCQCPEGYFDVNDYGYPACVPEKLWLVLRIYISVLNTVCIANAVRRAVLLRRDCPTRKVFGHDGLTGVNQTRMAFYLLSIVQCVSTLCFAIFVYPLGKLQPIYIIAAPSAGFAAGTMTCELWLETLPLQLLSQGTAAYTLKQAFRNRALVNGSYLAVGASVWVAALISSLTTPVWGRTALDILSCLMAGPCCVLPLVVGLRLHAILKDMVASFDPSRVDEIAAHKKVMRKIVRALAFVTSLIVSCVLVWGIADSVPLLRQTAFLFRLPYGVVPVLYCLLIQEVMKYVPPSASSRPGSARSSKPGSARSKTESGVGGSCTKGSSGRVGRAAGSQVLPH
ncbi:unnamed protein product [Chrysoparadoxa australica]